MTWHTANEVANKAVYAGTETVPGVAVDPTFQMLGEFTATKTQDLVDKQEMTGGYFRRVTPKLGVPTFAGTYAEDLTFESYGINNRYALKAGAAGTSDAATVPGYTRIQAPSHNVDDVDSFTALYGIDGLGFQSRGVRHNEHTVTIDVDDADGVWKWSSNLYVQSKEEMPLVFSGVATAATANTITMTGAAWVTDDLAGRYVILKFGSHVEQVRKIVSNTATVLTVDEAFSPAPTAGDAFRIEANFPVIAVPDYEPIPTYGTKVFIDSLGGTIGTTEVDDRIISVNYTYATNRSTKRFLNNSRDSVSRRTGRGSALVSGQLRVEFDRRTEYYKWENLQRMKLRIEQQGSLIDATTGSHKLARVDFVDVAFSTPTEDARENNMTLTIPFWGYGTVAPIAVTTKTKLATLP